MSPFISKWYGCYCDQRKKPVRVPLGTDKEAVQLMLAKLLRNKERGKAGLNDPFEHHLNRPVHTVEGQVDPAKAVRDGLQGLFRVRFDRDLLDQSGYPNLNGAAVVQWPSTRPVTLTAIGALSS